jgi:hypothetical protein
LRLAGKADIPVREHVLKRDDPGHVSELFLTATTLEVLPTVSGLRNTQHSGSR